MVNYGMEIVLWRAMYGSTWNAISESTDDLTRNTTWNSSWNVAWVTSENIWYRGYCESINNAINLMI